MHLMSINTMAGLMAGLRTLRLLSFCSHIQRIQTLQDEPWWGDEESNEQEGQA